MTSILQRESLVTRMHRCLATRHDRLVPQFGKECSLSPLPMIFLDNKRVANQCHSDLEQQNCRCRPAERPEESMRET